MSGRFGFRSRGYTYGLVVGTVVGLLTAGVAVPLVFGESLSSLDAPASDALGAPLPAATATGPTAPGASASSDPAAPPRPSTTAAPSGPFSAPRTSGDGAAPLTPTQPGDQPPSVAPSTGPGGDPAPAQPGGASDVGVTADRIVLGLLHLEATSYGRGAQEQFLGDPREQFQVFVDEVNARGGVHGRLLEPIYVPFDALDGASRRRACLEITEDHQVFVAMVQTNFIGPEVLCVTQEHATPLVSYNIAGPQEYYDLSEGRWFTAMQSWTRHYRHWISEMDRMGLLEGRTLGLLDSDYPPTKLVTDTVPALLAERGYELTKRFTFTGEISSHQSQIPVAVQEMKGAQVDTILVGLNFLTMSQFVTQADAQLYRPQYLTNEQSGVDANAASFMPAAYDGAIGITSSRAGEHHAGLPEPEADAECRSTYEQASGESMPRSSNPYQQVLAACWLIRTFEQVATAAGPQLTRAGFVAQLEQVSGAPLPFYGGGGFAPGKHDAADLVRTVRFQRDCHCFMPLDDFRRVED